MAEYVNAYLRMQCENPSTSCLRRIVCVYLELGIVRFVSHCPVIANATAIFWLAASHAPEFQAVKVRMKLKMIVDILRRVAQKKICSKKYMRIYE
jgi:hypothetical protein